MEPARKMPNPHDQNGQLPPNFANRPPRTEAEFQQQLTSALEALQPSLQAIFAVVQALKPLVSGYAQNIHTYTQQRAFMKEQLNEATVNLRRSLGMQLEHVNRNVDKLILQTRQFQQSFSVLSNVSQQHFHQHPLSKPLIDQLQALGGFVQTVLGMPALMQPYDVFNTPQATNRRAQLEGIRQWIIAQSQLALLERESALSVSKQHLVREQAINALRQHGVNPHGEPTKVHQVQHPPAIVPSPSQVGVPQPAPQPHVLVNLLASEDAAAPAAFSATPNADAVAAFGGPQDSTPVAEALEQPEATFEERLKQEHRFSIQKELGRGGMGVVYIATDPTGRRVALKRIMAVGDVDSMSRFELEAKSLAKIAEKVPGVPQLYHYFIFEGCLMFSQELEPGPQEYFIYPERLPYALLRNEDPVQLEYLKHAYEALSKYLGQQIKQIDRRHLENLLTFFINYNILPPRSDQRDHLSRLRMFITDERTKKDHYTPADVQQHQVLGEGITALYRLVRDAPVITRNNPEEFDRRTKLYQDPLITLHQYLQLSKVNEGAMDGNRAKLIFRALRELCGDDFPEDEMLKFWKYFRLDMYQTMQAIDEEGILHRDLKPANLLLSSRGADILLFLTDRLMYLATADMDEDERFEKMKEDICKAQKMCEQALFEDHKPLVKLIDFGLVKQTGQADKLLLRRSMSQIQPEHNAADDDGNVQLTLQGDVVGTLGYMPPERVAPIEGFSGDGPRCDLYGAELSIWEIYMGEKIVLLGKPQQISQLSTLACISKNADQARSENPKKAEKMRTEEGGVPLSAVDMNPQLVAILEDHDPELLNFVRRVTHLSEDVSTYTEVTWSEAVDTLRDELKPVSNTPAWLKAAYAAVGAVIVALVLGGSWTWYEGHKLEKEAEALVSRLDEDTQSLDLSDTKYTSDYFAGRIQDIQRVREIYGEGISPELKQKLEKQETFFEMLRLLCVASDSFGEFDMKHETVRKSDEGKKLLDTAFSDSQHFYNYLEKNNIHYTVPYKKRLTIPDEYIVPATTDQSQLEYPARFVSLANSDINEFFLKTSEYVLRTLEHNNSDRIFPKDLNEILKQTEFRSAQMLVNAVVSRATLSPKILESLPLETRQSLIHVNMRCARYFSEIYMNVENLESCPDLEFRVKVLFCMCMSGLRKLLPLVEGSEACFEPLSK